MTEVAQYDSATPHDLLDAFKDYLQRTDYHHLLSVDQPDLSALFTDLAGLKSEVKAESRQFKATLDTLSASLSALQDDNQAMISLLSGVDERIAQARREAQKTMLLEVIDIYDRLGEGYRVLQNYRPVNALFKHSKQQDVRFIESFARGQEMTLKRFEQFLQRQRVTAIVCVGQPFDVRTMKTLEIGHDPHCENGIVLEEFRKGFLFEDQVLRAAEVKVNKI